MTARELAFIDEYPKDWNGKEAAKRAKFAPKYAERYAHQLLQRADIQAAIAAKMKALTKKAEISHERLLAEFLRLGLSNIGDYVEWDGDGNVKTKPSSELTRGQMAAIQRIESDRVTTVDQEGRSETRSKLKIELHPKKDALAKLGEKYGLFPKEKAGDTFNFNQHNNFQQATDPWDLAALTPAERQHFLDLLRRAAPKVIGEGKGEG